MAFPEKLLRLGQAGGGFWPNERGHFRRVKGAAGDVARGGVAQLDHDRRVDGADVDQVVVGGRGGEDGGDEEEGKLQRPAGERAAE